MCYNHRAVERAWKPGVVSAGPKRDTNVSSELDRAQGERGSAEKISEIAERERSAMEVEDASRYCPVCSQRLEARRCKLICPVCGYYMSCADYY
jgi:hypothetical protein